MSDSEREHEHELNRACSLNYPCLNDQNNCSRRQPCRGHVKTKPKSADNTENSITKKFLTHQHLILQLKFEIKKLNDRLVLLERDVVGLNLEVIERDRKFTLTTPSHRENVGEVTYDGAISTPIDPENMGGH